MTKLTKPQAKALRNYSDGNLYNETQLYIHGNVYNSLRDKRLIKRVQWYMSRITEEGRRALAEHDRE
jgi:hypothetical protein